MGADRTVGGRLPGWMGADRTAGGRLVGGMRCGRAVWERAAVGFAAHFLQFIEQRAENVGVVVGNAGVLEVGEVFRAVDDGDDALEAHAGIDVLGGERREGAVGVGVVLDEDVVPNLDAAGVGAVDEFCAFALALDARVHGAGGEVHMDLGAGAAGAGVAHHPEVVFLVAVHDVDVGVEADGAVMRGPEFPGFLVAVGGVALGFVGLVNGGIDALGGEFPAVDDELPRPADGFLFEVVAEGPVAEHLEEGVVVGVEADVIEVVVLAAGADALLCVGGAGVAAGDCARPFAHVRAAFAEEDGDELVHARVGEKEVRRIRHERAARHDGVLLLTEEIEEALADLCAGHHIEKERGNYMAPGKGKAQSWLTTPPRETVSREAQIKRASHQKACASRLEIHAEGRVSHDAIAALFNHARSATMRTIRRLWCRQKNALGW